MRQFRKPYQFQCHVVTSPSPSQGLSTAIGKLLLGCQAIVGTKDSMQFLHPTSMGGVFGASHLATSGQWSQSGAGGGGSGAGDQGNGSLGVEPSTSLSIGFVPLHNKDGNANNNGSNSVGQSTFSLNSMITCTTGMMDEKFCLIR